MSDRRDLHGIRVIIRDFAISSVHLLSAMSQQTLCDLLRPFRSFPSWVSMEYSAPSTTEKQPCVTLVYTAQVSSQDFAAEWQKRIEALELLSLVAIVAPGSWRNAAQATCVANLPLSVDLSDDIDSRSRRMTYVLHAESTEDPQSVRELMQILSSPRGVTSDAYRTARDAIISMAINSDVRVTCESLRAPVMITCTSLGQINMVNEWAGRLFSPSARCDVIGVYLNCWHLTAELAHSVHAALSSGIYLEKVTFRRIAMDDRRLVTTIVSDMLGPHGAHSLDLSSFTQAPEAFEAFFSALPAASARVRSLSFPFPREGTEAVRRSKLLWILEGLFNREARHSVAHAQTSLWGAHVAQDLRWIAEMLRRQSRPPSELFLKESFDEYASLATTTDDRYVAVQQAQQIWTTTGGDDRRDLSFTIENPMELKVLRDDSVAPLIDVLVPGFGRCTVERAHGIKAFMKPATAWDLTQHTVRALSLGVCECSVIEFDAIAQLLHLVGRPVRELELWL